MHTRGTGEQRGHGLYTEKAKSGEGIAGPRMSQLSENR